MSFNEYTEFATPVNDGTTCCSLEICNLQLSCPDDIKRGWKSFTKPVEGVINQFQVKINPYRDTGKYYEIGGFLTTMNKLSLLKNSIEISQLTRDTKVFSINGCKDISSALCQLNGIGIMSVPPYIFVVGNVLGDLFVIDIHVIREELGGNGNGAIITFGKVEHCGQWLLKRLHLIGVREDSMQVIIKVSISSDVALHLKDNESSHTFSNSTHEILKPESDNVSKNMDDCEYANLTAVKKTF